MKKSLILGALALVLGASAQAAVVCDNCSYLQADVATNLGLHSTITEDNSTFGNSTTGQNGNFSNWWVFSIAPAGKASINAIFLPIANISNFDVDLYSLSGATCAANTSTDGGACSAFGVDTLIADGLTNPAWATVIDFVDLAVGVYAFNITGTISGLGTIQPASYTGNLQVNAQAVPEPGTTALVGAALMGIGLISRRKKAGPEDKEEEGEEE